MSATEETEREDVSITRSHRLVLRDTHALFGPEGVRDLPQVQVRVQFGPRRGSFKTVAVSAMRVTHTWDGDEWREVRRLTVHKLTKAGEPWGGYPSNGGMEVTDEQALPSEVAEWFATHPMPTTTITITEA